MAAIPAGIIIAWPTTASIPSGWDLVTTMYDRFPEGITDSDPGTNGGGATHVHDSAAHTHTHSHTHTATSGIYSGANQVGSHTSPNRSDALDEDHAHTINTADPNPTSTSVDHGDWAAGSSNPAYFTVRWVESDGDPTTFPDDSYVYFTNFPYETGAATLPSDTSIVQGDKFLIGAADGANGGAAAGGGSHTHATGAHTHTSGDHAHGSATSSTVTAGVSFRWDQEGADSWDKWIDADLGGGHSHSSAAWSSSGTVTSSALSSGTSGGTTYQPTFIKLLTLENTAANAPSDGMIVGWLDARSGIPDEWILCDGNNDTPDLDGKFIKGAASAGEVGDTGGTAGHQNSSGGHLHTAAHTHASSTLNSATINTSTYRKTNIYDLSTAILGYTGSSGDQPTTLTHNHDAGGTSSAASTNSLVSTSPTLSSTGDTRPAFKTICFLMYQQEEVSGSAVMFGSNF